MTRTNVSKLSRLERSFVTETQGPPESPPRVPSAVVGSINHHDLDAHRIRSDNHNYRRNTPNTLFRPRITPLCQDVRDTLMSRFSALAWPPF